MRRLSVLVFTLAGCTLPFDDFEPVPDAAVDGAIKDASTDSATTDAAADACTCVRFGGGKCRQWNPPGCMP
ncbi:MAG: hypothetical protein ACXWUE_41790 [Polyangiales bacterium]